MIHYSNSDSNLPYSPMLFSLYHKGINYPFQHPAEPDAVLDAVPEEYYEKDRYLPYWAENWPSAIPFFRYLLDTSFPTVHSAIELGCGLGVLSTALSLKSTITVSLDISPESCMYAHSNIHNNDSDAYVIAADWRALPLKKSFDLIVASDVLYEERWISVIVDCIESLLTIHGTALIADPCRRYWKQFQRYAEKHHFEIVLIHRERQDTSTGTVEIIELKRKSAIENIT